MKRLLSLLLAGILILSTAACGQDAPPVTQPSDTVPSTTQPSTPEPPSQEVTQPTTLANDLFDPEASAAIIGVWKTTLLLNGKLLNFADMEGFVEMELVYRLNADGTYSRGVDEQEFQMDLAAFESLVEQYMMDSYYTKFAAEKRLSGWGKERIDKEWEATEKAASQTHTDEFLKTLNLSYRFTNLNRTGDYYEQEGKLCFSKTDGSYETCGYLLEDSTLTLTDTDDLRPYRQMNITFPITLTKG